MAYEMLWGTSMEDPSDCFCFSSTYDSGIIDELEGFLNFTVIQRDEDGDIEIIQDLEGNKWGIETAYIDSPGFVDGSKLVEGSLKKW